jgi:hypothetical protein
LPTSANASLSRCSIDDSLRARLIHSTFIIRHSAFLRRPAAGHRAAEFGAAMNDYDTVRFRLMIGIKQDPGWPRRLVDVLNFKPRSSNVRAWLDDQ